MRRYTPQQVASIVQASPKELQEGIRRNHVILLDGEKHRAVSLTPSLARWWKGAKLTASLPLLCAGYYRMISPDYLMESLQTLLTHIDLHAYAYDSVPLLPTLSSLEEDHEMPKEMTKAILLSWFGNRKTTQSGDDETTEREALLELDMEAIVRFIGLQLLERKAKQAPTLLATFLLEWQAMLGANLGDRTKLEMLEVRGWRGSSRKVWCEEEPSSHYPILFSAAHHRGTI
jgi:hypothetical protein